MSYIKLIFFFTPLSLETGLLGRMCSTRISSQKSLTLPFPPALEKHHVKRLRSFLVQDDDWSCALRSVFHIKAIEDALKDPDHFEEQLKTNLRKKEALHTLDSSHGIDRGFSPYEIYAVAKKVGLKGKVICLDLEDSSQGIYCPLRRKYKKSLKQLLTKLTQCAQKAPCAVYVIAGTDAHAILFAFVNLPHAPARLYMIDSINTGLTPDRKQYINLLLPYLKKINKAKGSSQKHLSSKTKTLTKTERLKAFIEENSMQHPLLYALYQPYKQMR